MSSVTNQSNSIVDPLGWQRRDALYLAISLLIGAAGAVFRDLSESGLLLGGEAPVALFAPIWMIFFLELKYSGEGSFAESSGRRSPSSLLY